jgi:glycerol uptake facilitator-like aquaporin
VLLMAGDLPPAAMTFDSNRRLTSEALGTGFLVATVVGSGIMAAKLAGGNDALALLGNTVPTGAILVVLITVFGPISGAHFNPVVSLVMAARGDLPRRLLGGYVAAQILGGCLGSIAAHAMFGLPLLQISTTIRSGSGQWLAEGLATFGLLGTILGGVRFASTAVPTLVGLYITAAYWFTASTSFANPAVTIARALSNTFAGIAPASIAGFIVAQIIGALAAAVLFGWLFHPTAASVGTKPVFDVLGACPGDAR